MANSEIKNTAQSSFRDTKSTLRDASNPTSQTPSQASSSSVNEASNKMGDRMDSLKDTAQSFASDATPRVKQAYKQVSNVASDLYSRANGWMNQGKNKNYGFVAMVAAVGVLGFVLGRTLSSNSHSDLEV